MNFESYPVELSYIHPLIRTIYHSFYGFHGAKCTQGNIFLKTAVKFFLLYALSKSCNSWSKKWVNPFLFAVKSLQQLSIYQARQTHRYNLSGVLTTHMKFFRGIKQCIHDWFIEDPMNEFIGDNLNRGGEKNVFDTEHEVPISHHLLPSPWLQ